MSNNCFGGMSGPKISSVHFSQKATKYSEKRTNYSGELSTDKKPVKRTKAIYTRSYTHYPQICNRFVFGKMQIEKEQGFCENYIKMSKIKDFFKKQLTIIMSKINKKILKLLQKAAQLCYNDYTI